MDAAISLGGEAMSEVAEVVYHVVTPGDPDENGCCCLNGVRFGGVKDREDEAEVEVDGTGADVGEPVAGGVRCAVVSVSGLLTGGGRLRGLGPCVSNRMRRTGSLRRTLILQIAS